MPIGEIWFVLYEILLVLIGFCVCLAAVLWLRHHDAQKNHKIFVLEWQKSQLEGRLAALESGSDQKPMPEAPTAPVKAEPAPRQRRSAQKAKSAAPAPLPLVPQGIPQAELGRMQAQLKATGAARMIYHGGNGLWM